MMLPSSDTSIKLNWKMPPFSGGVPLKKCMVEYDYAVSGQAMQRITLKTASAQVSGSFCLKYDNDETAPIPIYSEGPGRVQYAIQSLPSIGHVDVSLKTETLGRQFTLVWDVKFLDNVGILKELEISCLHVDGGEKVDINVVSLSAGVTPTFASGSVGISEKSLGVIPIEITKSVQIITVND
jgi:hypothetical protein